MNDSDIDLFVLRQIVVFDFLGEFDHQYKTGNNNAHGVYEQFIKDRYPQWADDPYWSMANLNVALGVLTPVFCYATRITKKQLRELDFRIKSEYNLECRKPDDTKKEAEPREVIRMIRNSLAHYSDFLGDEYGPTVFFEPGVVTFFAKDYGKIEFSTERGFLYFISDLCRMVKLFLLKRHKERNN